MPPGVAFKAAPRTAAADLPSGCVVPARGAPHVDAIALEVQDRVVATKPADQLAETPKRPGHDAGRAVVSGCRRRRELLGVIGHHRRSPYPFSFYDATYDALVRSSVSR